MPSDLLLPRDAVRCPSCGHPLHVLAANLRPDRSFERRIGCVRCALAAVHEPPPAATSVWVD